MMKKITFFVCLIIVLFCGCENKSHLDPNDHKTEIELSNNERTEILDADSELVRKLYGYVLKFNYYDEILVYQDSKVTSENIDNRLKLLTAFENLDISEAEKIRVEADDPQYGFISGIEDDGYAYKYIYKKEIIEQKIKEIFGENATVIHESCSPYDGYKRIYENEKYICYAYEGGGDVPWSSSKSELVKAEIDGDNIYIYDKYIHMVDVDNIIDGINYAGTYDIYEASDRKVLIEEKVNSKNISNILNNKANIFKHIFSKNVVGNYYWVSTESLD